MYGKRPPRGTGLRGPEGEPFAKRGRFDRGRGRGDFGGRGGGFGGRGGYGGGGSPLFPRGAGGMRYLILLLFIQLLTFY